MKSHQKLYCALNVFFVLLFWIKQQTLWDTLEHPCVLRQTVVLSHAMCKWPETRLTAVLPDNRTPQLLAFYLEEDPNNQIIRLHLGQQLWDAGNTDIALTTWRENLETSYFFAEQSKYLLLKGDMEGALTMADISLSIQSDPNIRRHEMYRALCHAWLGQKKPEEALIWCERDALVIDDGWSRLTLSDVWFRLQDKKKAHTLLDQIIMGDYLFEHQLRALQKKGHVFLSEGDVDAALDAFHMAHDGGYQSPWLYLGLAESYLRLGRVDEACEYLTDAEGLNYLLSPAELEVFARCV